MRQPPATLGAAAVVAEWAPVTAEVVEADCGQVNAFYFPEDRRVVLCTEMVDQLPAPAVRGVLEHEMAHAAMDQLGLPETDPEADADELGTLVALDHHRLDEVADTAAWLMTLPAAPEGDPHPQPMDRAGMLLCLMDGSEAEPANPGCALYFRRATSGWNRALEVIRGR